MRKTRSRIAGLGVLALSFGSAVQAASYPETVLADAIRTLGHLFGGTGELPEPFGECGADPTADDLDCAEFEPCR